jgi:hypothetical protein
LSEEKGPEPPESISPKENGEPSQEPLEYPPQIVSNLSPEELEKLKHAVPITGTGIELESSPKNLNDLLGAMLAFFEKEALSVLDRTFLTAEEIPIFGGMIQLGSHGIGGGGVLDIPITEIAERVVNECHLRRSKNGDSSDRFERIMTAWLNVARLREEQKMKDSQQLVGMR